MVSEHLKYNSQIIWDFYIIFMECFKLKSLSLENKEQQSLQISFFQPKKEKHMGQEWHEGE